MVLRVSLEDFAETAERVLGVREAYISARGPGTLITAGIPQKAVVVLSETRHTPDQVRPLLEKLGMTLHTGRWTFDEEAELSLDPCEGYVAVVAYKSKDPTPGLWVDAYPYMPTPTEVLRNLYDELVTNGEMRQVPYDEFLEYAKANLLIIPPDEIAGFVAQKALRECDPPASDPLPPDEGNGNNPAHRQ